MFSEELLELDRNTVEFMIEDMRRQIEEKDEQLKQLDEQIKQKDEQSRQLDEQIKQSEQEIQKRAREIVQKFDNCGMKLEILNDQYLIQVCNSFTNMSVATKEDSDYQDYIPHLVA